MKLVQFKSVQNAVLTAMYADPRVQTLREFVRAGAQVYVMAGAVRDAIAADFGLRDGAPRDFDIAVAGIKREFFDEVLHKLGRKNRHGGYVLANGEVASWDIWRLEESIGLKKTGTPCSLAAVLRTFNLNCNAIAMDFRSGLFFDSCAIDAIWRRRVGFVEQVIHHSEDTFAAKALLLNLRLNYALDPQMTVFVQKHLKNSSLLYEGTKVFPNIVPLPSLTSSALI
jgi:hypothetical protein